MNKQAQEDFVRGFQDRLTAAGLDKEAARGAQMRALVEKLIRVYGKEHQVPIRGRSGKIPLTFLHSYTGSMPGMIPAARTAGLNTGLKMTRKSTSSTLAGAVPALKDLSRRAKNAPPYQPKKLPAYADKSRFGNEV